MVPMHGLWIVTLQETPKDLGRTKIVRKGSAAMVVREARELATLLRLVCDTAALRSLRGGEGFYKAAFQSVSLADFGTGDWKVARTRRLESLRYGCYGGVSPMLRGMLRVKSLNMNSVTGVTGFSTLIHMFRDKPTREARARFSA
jgi:hypothetical protein